MNENRTKSGKREETNHFFVWIVFLFFHNSTRSCIICLPFVSLCSEQIHFVITTSGNFGPQNVNAKCVRD